MLFFASIIGPIFIFLLGKTLRMKWIGEGNLDPIRKNQGQVIYACWHGRMLILFYSHRWQRIHVLISQHRDGELIARIIKRLGFVSVRGSTTRGGTKALFEMATKGASGYDVGITPDGPRGPKFKVQPGAIYIAQRSGMPLIPITNSAKSRWTLSSWDGFLIPKPFSKAVIIIGEPIYVPLKSTPQELEEKREELEKRLVELTQKADSYFR
ncbi:MAG: lysophospholipid acyltransferase family protein [candidate division Zixibacteria bacterium]|nr:lysophospholipid acyltransferase family protein [candidate division Zixibacteria bacterium]